MEALEFFVNGLTETTDNSNTIPTMDLMRLDLDKAAARKDTDFSAPIRVKKDAGNNDDDANDMINRYLAHRLSHLGTTSFMISRDQLDDYLAQENPRDKIVAYQFFFARNNKFDPSHEFGRMTVILAAVAQSGKHVYFKNPADGHDYVLEHCLPCPGTGCPAVGKPGDPVLENGR